jgi:hypothetical protein
VTFERFTQKISGSYLCSHRGSFEVSPLETGNVWQHKNPPTASFRPVNKGFQKMNMHVAMIAAPGDNLQAEWVRKLTEFRFARDEHEQFTANTYSPVSARLERIAPYPGCLFEVKSRNGRMVEYRLYAADLHALDDNPSPVVRKKAEALRGRWLEHLAVRKALDLDAIASETERLCDQMCDREGDVLETPSPDITALLWKLERLFGPDVCKDDAFCDSWCPMDQCGNG